MGEHTPAPSPGRSYYGFVLYLLGWSGIGCYIVWAFVPHKFLASFDLTYVPQPYWALALPSVIIMMLLTFVFFVYPAINFMHVSVPNDLNNIIDSKSIKMEEYPQAKEFDVPPAYDLDISQVCRELYKN